MGRKRHHTESSAGTSYRIRDHIEGLETRIMLSRAVENALAELGTRSLSADQFQPHRLVQQRAAMADFALAASDPAAPDIVGPRVIGSSIQQDGVLPVGTLSITIQFDEPMKTSNIDKGDFELANATRTAVLAAGSFSLSASGDAITVNYSNVREDRYTFKLISGNGQFEDVAGNDLDGETTAASWPIPSGVSGDGVPGGNFTVGFEIDADTTPFPALQPVNPVGGAEYSNTTVRRLGAPGDHDSYTIALDAGQTLTAVVEGAGLQLHADVLDPQGTLIASALAAAPGKNLLLPSLPIAVAGTYTVTLSTVDGSVGDASLTLSLNRTEAAEDFTGVSDDTQASAQDLDPVLTPIVAGASGAGRVVIHGSVNGQLNDIDYYRLTLDAGDTLSAAVYPVLLTLVDPAGNVITLSRSTPSQSAVIADYIVPVAGKYYLRAETTPTSGQVAYNLLVLRNLGLDVEANDSSVTSQYLLARPIAGVQTYVGTAESDVGDRYRFMLKSGTPLHATTATPGDGTIGEPVNTLNPILRLFNAFGTQFAIDDNSAPDGHNAVLTYTPTADGVYFLQIGAAILNPTDPDYVLSVTGAITAPPQVFTASPVSPVNNAKLTIIPTAVRIDFNDAVDFTTLQPMDLMIDGIPASAMTIVDADTASFTPGVPIGQGTHTITIAKGAVSNLQSTPLEALTSSFLLDSQGPHVVNSSIQENGVATAGNLTYSVKFDERLLTGNIDASDFTLRGNGKLVNYTPSHFALDSAGTTLTLEYANLPEDHYTLTLISGTGRFEDPLGNDLDGEPNFPTPPNVSGNGTPGGNFVVNFDLDNTADIPLTPLTPISPPLSLAYQVTTNGLLNNATDTDTFTLNLDPGQTLTLLLNPTATFRGHLDVLAPDGKTIASATSTFVGQPILLQNLPVISAGVYTLVVSAADAGSGTFNLTVNLNAAREQESFGAASNHTPETAQDLNAVFTTPMPGIARATVLGSLEDLFLADFESGAGGFTTDNAPAGGLWHLSSGRAVQSGHSVGRSFYFGQGETTSGGGNYNTGTRAAGYLISSSIDLPATGTITMSFNHVLQTGTSAAPDQALVQITTDNGANWTTLASYGQIAESAAWRSASSLNLNAYAGQSVKLRWSFDTVDASTSSGEGWYVDDVRVQATAAVSPDYYGFDLSAGDHLSLSSWVSGVSAVNLVLMDANGATLASALSGGVGIPATIDQYAVRNAGRYYARLTGPAGVTYTLLLAKNAALQRGTDNSSAASAQDITPSGGVIGHLSSGALTQYATDNFESGTTLGPAWSTYSSTANGRIRVTGQYTTAGGALALVMDTATINANLNEATYTVNLNSPVQSTLSFAHDSFADELTLLPADFTGHANGDGIAISADGVHWHTIWTPPASPTNVWTTYTLDLASLAAQGGIPLGAGFQIKFQQYDDNPLPTDGRGWDNIVINASGSSENFYALNLIAGQTLSLTSGTPGDGPGEYLNNLDPRLDVYDPLGNLIASDDNSAPDGHNARLSFLLPISGRYVVRVRGTSGPGDYVLRADVQTSENPPPARPNLSPASDTGRSNADDLTAWNNHDTGSALVFSIDQVTPGATVTLYADGQPIGSAVALSSSVLIATQPGITLADGRHLFTARQTLAGKPESGDSAALAVTIDTAAPLVPPVAALQSTSDGGVPGDGITNDTTPTLRFDPGSGNYFRLFIDGRQISGDYEGGTAFTPNTLADGTYDLLYAAVDAAGNVSGLSAPFALTIRTTRPAPPTLPLTLDPSSDTGLSNTDNLTNDNTPTFILPAGLIAYRVYRNGVLISGIYETGKTFTAPAQPDGTASFTLTAVDIAGNESLTPSPALSVIIDTAAPAATIVPDLEASSDSGFSNTDDVTNDTTPTFDLATLPAGTFYRIYRDNVLISGSYESISTFTTLPQPDGAATYTVRVVDAAGNASAASSGLKVTILTSALPIVPDLITQQDSGVSNSDNITRFVTPVFNLPGAFSYRMFRDGVEVSGGGAISGDYTERTPLAEGVYSYRGIVIDLAGNVSALSDPLLVTIDTTAPAAPPIPDLEAASDSGVSSTDNVTNVARPVLDLSLGQGNYYWILLDGNFMAANMPGSTYTPLIALADGLHVISASAVDAAGNASPFSPNFNFTVDTTPPRLAQVAELDPQFAAGRGWSQFGVGTTIDNSAGAVVLADGRIMTGGMSNVNGILYGVVYRFLPDGRPDLTFGQNGLAKVAMPTGAQSKLAVGPDGSIVLASSPRIGDPPGGSAGVLKLTSSGQPDTSFGPGGQRLFNQFASGFRVQSVAIQPDGKVVIGGCLLTGPAYSDKEVAILRLNADGSPDLKFGPNGLFVKDLFTSVEDYADTLIPFPDGSLLATVFGEMPGPDYSSPAAIRFGPDGSLDDSYGVHGVAINPLRFLTVDGGFVQADGKLVVYGYGLMGGLMARFNPDGSPDSSFAGGGFARTPSDIGLLHTTGAFRLADGRYLMLAQISEDASPYYQMAFVMFTSNGGVDPTFGDQGFERFALGAGADWPNSLVQTPDGRALAAGDYNETGDSQFFLAQFAIKDNLRLTLRNAGGSTGGGGGIVTSATNLVFDIVHPDSYYRVYRNGTLISGAYANTAAFTASGQPEGTWDYTVTAVDAAGNESAPGAAVRITIDTTPPSVLSTRFDPEGSGGSLRVAMSEGIVLPTAPSGPGPSLSSLDGGASATAALGGSERLNVSYDNSALTLTLNGALADGNYRLTIPAAWLCDAAGNPMSADFTFDFYILGGDANRDRAVDFKDLAVLAQNYNTTDGETWAQGDFTGDGKVDFNDLVKLAQNYNSSLPGAPAPSPTANFSSDLTAAFALAAPKPTIVPVTSRRPPAFKPKPAPVVRPPVAKTPAPVRAATTVSRATSPVQAAPSIFGNTPIKPRRDVQALFV